MDRTEVNASPVQKALQGIKKYKYVLLTALLGVLLLLLPQNEKAADSGSATPSAAENFDREALQNEMEDILSSLDGVGKLSLMLTVEGGGAYELAQDETASLKARGEEVDEQTRKTETVVLGTVSGDIHTIGKTLVSIMLRSAGFHVVDLGTNVPPEKFVAAARENNSHIIAISAMLTTTVAGMKKTIRALREAEESDQWHIIVGGAPVNGRFAREHNAEYAADAVETVNLALKACGIDPLPDEKL